MRIYNCYVIIKGNNLLGPVPDSTLAQEWQDSSLILPESIPDAQEPVPTQEPVSDQEQEPTLAQESCPALEPPSALQPAHALDSTPTQPKFKPSNINFSSSEWMQIGNDFARYER